MYNMKAGDYVVCVNNFGYEEVLTFGKVYKLVDSDVWFYRINNDSGRVSGYYIYRFISLVESRRLKLVSLIKLSGRDDN